MKNRKGNLLRRIMTVLFAVALLAGMAPVDAQAMTEDTATCLLTLNITVEGYEGNDPAVLGVVTLKNTTTNDIYTPEPQMQGNKITYKQELPAGGYRWDLGGIEVTMFSISSNMTAFPIDKTFYSVYFKNGADTYATEYVLDGRKVTAPSTPTKEGYTFAGWVTEEDGETPFDFSQPVTGVTTVYASWTEAAEPPVITKQPYKKMFCGTDSSHSLAIEARGDNLTYQWQVNRNDGAGFVNIAGETNAEITIAYPEKSQDGHLYRCVVTNAGGSVTSKESELVVQDARANKAEQVVREAVEEMPVTNDTDKESIRNIANAALSNAGITEVDVTIADDFSKTEATEDAPGNIRAYISIGCGGISLNGVEFNRDIARLHTCRLSLVSGTEPGCTTAGKKAYYHCAGCGKNYADAEGTALIYDLASWGNIAALGHDYGTEWDSDEENHWHACSRCDAKTDVSAHTEDDGTVTKEPTETETGIRAYCCSVCRKELRTETIPATGGKEEPGGESGEVGKEVERGENAPVTSLFTPVKELVDLILTPEEKQQIADGTDIKIILDVKDASGNVSSADKAAVETALNGFTTGQYIDISLFKVMGENRSTISETQGKIMITLAVPEALKNTDSSRSRTYAVIRVHNGQAELLDDLDGDSGTITIATDKFSTYAIVYKDTVNAAEQGSDNGTKTDNEPKTGDNTPVALYAFLAMSAGFSCLLLYMRRRYDLMKEIKK